MFVTALRNTTVTTQDRDFAKFQYKSTVSFILFYFSPSPPVCGAMVVFALDAQTAWFQSAEHVVSVLHRALVLISRCGFKFVAFFVFCCWPLNSPINQIRQSRRKWPWPKGDSSWRGLTWCITSTCSRRRKSSSWSTGRAPLSTPS